MIKSLFVIAMSIVLSACHSSPNSTEEISKKNTKVASINVQLGMAYLEQGNLIRAKQKLLYAVKKDPKLPEAWYSLAYLLEKTGSTSEANQNYLTSIKLAPARGDVQNNYGTFLCRTGQYNEAINHFLLATKDPKYLDSAGAYENAGLCALKIPDKVQAIKYFTLALEQDPTRILPMNELSKLKG